MSLLSFNWNNGSQCWLHNRTVQKKKKKRPGLISVDSDLLFWGRAREVGQFQNYSGDSNMQPGPRISVCVWVLDRGGRWGVMMERKRKSSRQKRHPSSLVCY